MTFINNPNTIRFIAGAIGIGDFFISGPYSGCTVPGGSGGIDSKIYQYYAQSPDGSQYEYGYGALSYSTHTIARTNIVATSNDDQILVNFTSIPIIDIYPSPSPLLETTNVGVLSVNYSAVSNFSFSTATYTVVPFDTIVRDTSPPTVGYSLSTHSYFPNIPGDYYFSASVFVTGTGAAGYPAIAAIYKNGVQTFLGSTVNNTGTTLNQAISVVHGILTMNGSSDVMDIRVYSNLTSPIVPGSSGVTSYLTGFLIH